MSITDVFYDFCDIDPNDYYDPKVIFKSYSKRYFIGTQVYVPQNWISKRFSVCRNI